jgi:hypothetical protein
VAAQSRGANEHPRRTTDAVGEELPPETHPPRVCLAVHLIAAQQHVRRQQSDEEEEEHRRLYEQVVQKVLNTSNS